MARESVAIIGSGVIGLTTAIALQERGYHNISIYTEKQFSETTSAKAGAVFEPYHPGDMSTEEMLRFVTTGLVRYGEIIENCADVDTGIRSHRLYATSTDILVPKEIPYLPAIPDWKLVTGVDAPGYYRSAVVMDNIPFIDPTIALRYLAGQVEKVDGSSIKRPYRKINDLQQFVDHTPEEIVINCAGLGARELNNDPEIQPMRGQIAVMKYMPENDSSILGSDGYYIFPRTSGELILGGTTELGEEDEVTDEATIERIISNAMLFLPDLKREDLIRTYAGLRPFRTSGARVAQEDQPNEKKKLFSSVGFGGSGWTFAWGAAEKIAQLVTKDRE